MATRKKRKKKAVTPAEIKEAIEAPLELEEVKYDEMISTGSTLLDLSISGGKVRGGGIPAGIMIEIFGPSSSGKTSILAEISASIKSRKGSVRFLDPEARLDKEYCRIYGFSLKEQDYYQPDTVNEMFKHIWDWKPESADSINLIAADSLAALSTEIEMESEDKMSMKRAKDFSQGLRKSCRIISKKRYILACTNQEREKKGGGLTTPGGKGIGYYSSLRIRVFPNWKNNSIAMTRTIGSKAFEKTVGIRSICEIKKSSVDDPYRTCPLIIKFGYGVDDIMANLEFYKSASGDEKFSIFKRSFATVQPAIRFIEKNGLEEDLRETVIETWEMIQEKFKIDRKTKVRF